MTLEEKNKIVEDLYLRKKKLVRYYCTRFAKNDDSEDLTHDVFVRVFRDLHKFKNKCKIDTWLYCITRTICLNYHRKSKVAKRKGIEIHLNSTLEENRSNKNTEFCYSNNKLFSFLEDKKSISPFQQACNNQYSDFINKEFKKMSQDHQECLLEFFGLGDFSSYKEVSENLNVPIGTIKSRISRAKKELKAFGISDVIIKKVSQLYDNPSAKV